MFAKQGKLNLYSLIYQILRVLFYLGAILEGISMGFSKGHHFKPKAELYYFGALLFILRGIGLLVMAVIGLLLGHPLYFGSKKMDAGNSASYKDNKEVEIRE